MHETRSLGTNMQEENADGISLAARKRIFSSRRSPEPSGPFWHRRAGLANSSVHFRAGMATFLYSRLCVPEPITPQRERQTGLCLDFSLAAQMNPCEGILEFRAHTENMKGSLPWDCGWTEVVHSEGQAGGWRVVVGLGKG